ncbi:hypothetical protein AAE478_003418 [Parahypoxylon ruwenzoriense]
MDYSENQYAGLEPSDAYFDVNDILDGADFDAPDITAELFSFPDPTEPPAVEPPAVEAPVTEPSHTSLLDIQDFILPPELSEPAYEPVQVPPPAFINPMELTIHKDITGVSFHQLQQRGNGMNYAAYNDSSANLYPPMLSLPVPIPPAPKPNPYPLPQPMNGDAKLAPVDRRKSVSDSRRSSDMSGYSNASNSLGQSTRRSSINRPPSPYILRLEPPLKRPDKGPNGMPLKSGRIPRVTRKNQLKPDAREWYGPSPPQPDNWGPEDRNGRPLFKYTVYGELERGKAYTARELRWYFYGPNPHRGEEFALPNRLPGVPEVRGKLRQGLTLWIGWVSPQSNERYPFGSQSHKCRFADCADSNRTIRTGLPHIIFDERMNEDGDAIDVFHNAGYAHLYCFERHFDLVDAMIRLDVRPDERSFKREDANLSKLSRQFPEIRNEIDDWWREEYPKWLRGRETGHRRRRDHEFSLNYRLVCHATENGTEARAKMRDSRGGADISKHKGDLMVWRFLRECKQYGLVDEHGDPIPDAEAQLSFLQDCKHYGLLDEYDEPVPDARVRLRELKAKGRTKKAAVRKAQRTKPIKIPSRQPPSAPPGFYYPQPDAYAAGYGAEFYSMPDALLRSAPLVAQPLSPYFPMPMPMPQPLVQPYDMDYPMAMVQDLNRPTPSPTSFYTQQVNVEPVTTNPPRKRDRDEALAEDQNLDFPHNNTQTETEESPSKKQRQESPTVPDAGPEIHEIHDEQHIEVGSSFEEPFLEPEVLSAIFSPPDFNEIPEFGLDEKDVFDIIDNEMCIGESSPDDDNNNIDTTGDPEEKGSAEQEQEQEQEQQSLPIPDILDDLELREGEDLFGDIPNEEDSAG